MGLAPRKGAIQVGADADLAIIHPTRTHVVDPATMETNADWSPYEGWELAGFARTTLSRGEVIVDDYRVVGREGRGQWLPRRTAGLQAARPTSHPERSEGAITQPGPLRPAQIDSSAAVVR